MNLKQLQKIKATLRTDFLMYEGRMFDLLHEGDPKEFASVSIHFIDMYFIYEEAKTILSDYSTAKQRLTSYLLGEEYWEWPIGDDETKPTIWETILMPIEGEGRRFYLGQISGALHHYISIMPERNKGMQAAFDKFFPGIQTGVVQDGELVPLTPQQEGQRRLSEEINLIETSFSVEDFLERMGYVKQLCEAEADPCSIVVLFP